MKIAFVEDDKVWSRSVCEILTFEGHDVDPVFSVNHDIDFFQKFDLVISDNKLDHPMSGMQLITKLRKHGYEGILMLYTSYPLQHVEMSCEALDAYAVSKQDDIADAVAMIIKVELQQRIGTEA